MINSQGFEENLYFSDGSGKGKEGWIRCNSGVYINIFNPNPEHFLIEDIAHGLSMMPRFGGHIPVWYSVADHSIACCYYTNKRQERFELLMHDASEAYLMDIVSPIKRLLGNYKDIEDKFMNIISNKFGFQYPLSDFTKSIDKQQLEVEWDEFIIKKNCSVSYSIEDSKSLFLQMYEKYKP